MIAPQTTIETMCSRIAQASFAQKIIVFGSYARGTPGNDSDVDILVVVNNIKNRRKEEAHLYKLLAGSGISKDIIIVSAEELDRYGHIPGTMVHSALKEGKVLYDAAR